MPVDGDFSYPCVLCSFFLLILFIFSITYFSHKDFFASNSNLRGGYILGCIFCCITLLYVIIVELITDCVVDPSQNLGPSADPSFSGQNTGIYGNPSFSGQNTGMYGVPSFGGQNTGMYGGNSFGQ